ncbi:hypothetical protein SAY87_021989 [Trapa incisa]|uniref:Uncharacterized protein n=1 Tax=Trapa incisa TaxID=236973 RepID=A0AAN7JT75_9MYRT|nr:hypothetical protein SAY87_021989 [Trapa incisa]
MGRANVILALFLLLMLLLLQLVSNNAAASSELAPSPQPQTGVNLPVYGVTEGSLKPQGKTPYVMSNYKCLWAFKESLWKSNEGE